MDRHSKDLTELVTEAAGNWRWSGFCVVLEGEEDYDEARRISNSRFDRKPAAIAFPRSTEHVAQCIRFCRDNGIDIRIRSGGHQHEGMCSGDSVLMIRLSEMKDLPPIDEETEEAWIPTGARLEDVYWKLQESNKIIAGGGCKSVNVGGLTLGGGWGLSARKFGLACDNVQAVEVVLSTGVVVVARRSNRYADLFWALLGSGGGNFGIATRFLFQLRDIEPLLSKYKVYWQGAHRTRVIERWLSFQRQKQSRDTTSYLVLFAKLRDGCYVMPSVYAGGMKYGSRESVRTELQNWIEDLRAEGIEPARKLEIKEFHRLIGLDADEPSDASPHIVDFLSYADFQGVDEVTLGLVSENIGESDCRVQFPAENCKGAHPHKVSSAFPIDYRPCMDCEPERPCAKCRDYEARLARTISDYIEQNPVDLRVKSYISLYSMGGAIANREPKASAFWYRQKKFVIQIESWWNYPENREEACRADERWQEPHIEWVRNFRETLRSEGLVEGAFINFIDRDVELKEYYGGNFERLKQSKSNWDPSNFFGFEKGIPPA